LFALMLALNEGHDWGWLSPAVLGCLAAAVVLLGAFLWLENRRPAPMLDLSLFRVRVFSAATASAILNYVCLYFVIFLMPFYLMQGRNLGPAEAGLFLTAQPIIMAIAAPISGSLSDRMGSRLLSTLGMLILAIGLFLLSRLGPATPPSLTLAGLAVAGLGTGIFISPNTSALLGSAPRQRQGIASGILATARNVGMVLGVGLAGAIFTTLTVAGGDAMLFSAVTTGFVVASGLAVVGIVVSSVRGNTAPARH